MKIVILYFILLCILAIEYFWDDGSGGAAI